MPALLVIALALASPSQRDCSALRANLSQLDRAELAFVGTVVERRPVRSAHMALEGKGFLDIVTVEEPLWGEVETGRIGILSGVFTGRMPPEAGTEVLVVARSIPLNDEGGPRYGDVVVLWGGAVFAHTGDGYDVGSCDRPRWGAETWDELRAAVDALDGSPLPKALPGWQEAPARSPDTTPAYLLPLRLPPEAPSPPTWVSAAPGLRSNPEVNSSFATQAWPGPLHFPHDQGGDWTLRAWEEVRDHPRQQSLAMLERALRAVQQVAMSQGQPRTAAAAEARADWLAALGSDGLVPSEVVRDHACALTQVHDESTAGAPWVTTYERLDDVAHRLCEDPDAELPRNLHTR